MNKFFYKIKFLFVTLLRLFYSFLKGGENCVVCGKSVYLIPVCEDCKKSVFTFDLSVERCKCCGKVLISEKDVCMECRVTPVFAATDFMLPLYSYRMWNKELMFLWKIKNIRSLSYFFASRVAFALRVKGVRFVVPVPPRKGKISKNGWDQIDELCSLLECFFGFDVLKILERNTEKQQKKLDRAARLITIESAYSMVSEQKLKSALKRVNGVLPDSVCIVDDVCTTGSTLECCAKLLKKYGVKRVGAISIFNVD